MKYNIQHIKAGVDKDGEFLHARRVIHPNKRPSKHESRMDKFRQYLYKNYDVYSITKIKNKITRSEARSKSLAFAGFTPQNM